MVVHLSACASKEEKRIAKFGEQDLQIPEAEFTSDELTALFLDVCIKHADDPSYARKVGDELGLKRIKTPSPEFYRASTRASDGGEIELSFGDGIVLWHSSTDAGSYEQFTCRIEANIGNYSSSISDQVYETLVAEPNFESDIHRWRKRKSLSATLHGRDGVLFVGLPYPRTGRSSGSSDVPDCTIVGTMRFALEIWK